MQASEKHLCLIIFAHSNHACIFQSSNDMQVSEKQLYEAEKQFKAYEAMISAMEEEERTNPDVLAKSPARRRRVAQVGHRYAANGTTYGSALQCTARSCGFRCSWPNVWPNVWPCLAYTIPVS